MATNDLRVERTLEVARSSQRLVTVPSGWTLVGGLAEGLV